jgi:hypothetical protein
MCYGVSLLKPIVFPFPMPITTVRPASERNILRDYLCDFFHGGLALEHHSEAVTDALSKCCVVRCPITEFRHGVHPDANGPEGFSRLAKRRALYKRPHSPFIVCWVVDESEFSLGRFTTEHEPKTVSESVKPYLVGLLAWAIGVFARHDM